MPASVFEKVSTDLDFPREELQIQEFWRSEKIFEKSLERRKDAPPFVFYEGPPTANGLPHNGHVLTRVIKDLFPRYKTMRGFRVPRKAGWDTHGLPVEVEVEKELRIHGKAAIESYGVEPFVKKCIESVFRYTTEWEELTRRVGFWVDLKDAYVTYHRSYVESVWWALSELFKKGLLYQGHKVVWWWAQGGTALSSGEVGLGYKEVHDPSVYVAFPLAADIDGGPASLLVWTTTPWTLPSNMYAAVNPSFEYALVRAADGKRYVLARDLVAPLAKKFKLELTVEREMKGEALAGLVYHAPFEAEYTGGPPKGATARPTGAGRDEPLLYRVLTADFVTLDTGTGIVHIAPAFGEDDHKVHMREVSRFPAETKLPLLCAVAPDGTFNEAMPRYKGRWVKDCDKDITKDLKEKGLLLHAETYKHDYPFCWRSDNDPLIQYARPAWYIKTTAVKDDAIANNRAVHWLPDHIKEGRFGDFLAHNVDWALSRERYWGTPLNVWICTQSPGHLHAPASVAEIKKRNPLAFDHFESQRAADPTLSEHLIVHKPWIDAVVFPCPACGAEMRRVPEVIDCWFDSGCMPFAQWGFPHEGKDAFVKSFPADFISEAIDQTRGWFYSLLMIATLVFDENTAKKYDHALAYPLPYKTCIVLGHVSDREGKKESKSKGNYTPPDIILDAVKMDFAVLDVETTKVSGKSQGVAHIAQEDYEGLDLAPGGAGARVTLVGPGGSLEAVVHPTKALPRRVVALHAADIHALKVKARAAPDVMPVEVPRLPADERVTVRDPSTPAPGADAFRWFFYASGPPWNATRHSLSNVRALQKEFLVKLRNVYSFFTIYANIDEFDPWGERGKEPVSLDRRGELDRWILGELQKAVTVVTKKMDDYDVYGATQVLTELVDALSNWYVRRSRARFWKSGWDDDKAAAYQTLYEALVTTTKLIAPFVPFTAETMYQNLVRRPARRAGAAVPESVHLLGYPRAEESRFNEALKRKTNLMLSDRVRAVRELVSLGLQVRTQAKLKVRQPLRSAYGVVVDPSLLAGAVTDHLKQELNVLEFHPVSLDDADRFVTFRLKPSFRALGQRGLGREAQGLKTAMSEMTPAEAAETASKLLAGGEVSVSGVTLGRGDVEIELAAREGFAAAGAKVGVIVLDTKLDDELVELGLLRELLSRVQGARKEMGLEYTDRIRLALDVGPDLAAVVDRHREAIRSEVLADEVTLGAIPEEATELALDVDGHTGKMGLRRAS